MEFRKIESLGVKLSLLGFGCMRFPAMPDGKIDEDQSEKMIDAAVEAGINYFDSAYTYHNGESEPFIGKVLKKYARDSIYIATKLPPWKIEGLKDARDIFETQLKRLKTDYIDFYLLHGLDRDSWKKIKNLKIIEFAEELKKQEKIKFLGFSFHDEYEILQEILEYRKWDFCQIQLNYMDTEFQAGIKGYRLTEKMNVPVIIMEPLKGGALGKIPEDIEKNFKDINKDATTASWGLRWAASLPNVKVILSGMSTYEQLIDNINTFTDFKPLNKIEKEAVDNVRQAFNKHLKNGCSGCGYCMPCPNDVNISYCFQLWNDLGKYKDSEMKQLVWLYWDGFGEGKRADECTGCGECEDKCPQHLNIRDDLRQAAKDFEKIKPH